MTLRSLRLWMAAVLLPVALQGCGSGGGSSTPQTFEPPSINPTIAAWPAGTSWTYRVVNSANSTALTRTMIVRNPSLTSPIDQHPVLELVDSATDGTNSVVLNDYYFRQDSTGTVYLEGLAIPGQNNTTSPLFVKSPSTVIVYPSPMTLGEAFNQPTISGGVATPFTVTYSDNSVQSVLQTVVTGTSTVPVPIGAEGSIVNVPAFVLTQHNITTDNTTGATDSRTSSTFFNPSIGIVEIQVVDTITQAGLAPVTNSSTSILTATTQPH